MYCFVLTYFSRRLIDFSKSKKEVSKCLTVSLPIVIATLGTGDEERRAAAVRFLQNSIGDSTEGDRQVSGHSNTFIMLMMTACTLSLRWWTRWLATASAQSPTRPPSRL